MLILTFGIQLAYASRNANTQFRVCLFYSLSLLLEMTSVGFEVLNFEFYSSRSHIGKAIPCRVNRHRIRSFIQLLHHTRLVFVGIKSNNVIFSIVHSITTHKHHHDGSHLSAKDLLST